MYTNATVVRHAQAAFGSAGVDAAVSAAVRVARAELKHDAVTVKREQLEVHWVVDCADDDLYELEAAGVCDHIPRVAIDCNQH